MSRCGGAVWNLWFLNHEYIQGVDDHGMKQFDGTKHHVYN